MYRARRSPANSRPHAIGTCTATFDSTDVKLRAPLDALTLIRKLGMQRPHGRRRVLRELMQLS